tara:strand:- start:1744 stop:2052 length:309 start_codon:yes stop_codon:yes gene_type:complete
MIKKNLFLIILFLLVSCSSLRDAGNVISNKKIATTDEFLVKKKEPLVIPPNYSKIPKPDDITNDNTNDGNQIKKILKSSKKQKTTINNNSTVEKSILDRISK